MFDQIEISLLEDFKVYLQQVVVLGWHKLLWIIFWPIMLYLPLKGIERDDLVTGALYILYLVASGFLLVAIPLNHIGSSYSNSIYVFLFFVFSVLGYMRWQKLQINSVLESFTQKDKENG